MVEGARSKSIGVCRRSVKKDMIKSKIFFYLLSFFIILSILALNFWVISPWFFGQGPINLGSIEVSYVSMARFIRDFYPHLSFAPFWYFGFPFYLLYLDKQKKTFQLLVAFFVFTIKKKLRV